MGVGWVSTWNQSLPGLSVSRPSLGTHPSAHTHLQKHYKPHAHSCTDRRHRSLHTLMHMGIHTTQACMYKHLSPAPCKNPSLQSNL